MSSVWADSDRNGKRRLLGKLLTLRGVSVAAIVHILQLLESEPTVRWGIRSVLSDLNTSICSKIELALTSGGSFSWDVAALQDVLPQCLNKCAGFQQLFSKALSACPPSFGNPWSIVLYLDEITPGNPLRPDNKRKMTAFYASFLQLGGFLRVEEAWLTLGILRSSIVKDVKGGMSGVLRSLLRDMFLGPRSLRTGGIVVHGTILFAKFGRLLGDEAAGKSVWSVKGAAGTRPCLDCKNVVSIATDRKESLIDFDDAHYLVDISCPDVARFDPMSNEELWRSHDILSRMKTTPGITRAEFENVEKASGVVFNPDGLMADLELRAHVKPSSNARDPMHTVLANGVMNTEIYAFLRAVAQCTPGFRYATMAAFCEADWSWPRARGKMKLADLFSEVRESSSLRDQSFKAGASETLSVYPVIRYFIEVAVAPTAKIPQERASFLSFCRVVDLMQAAKAGDARSLTQELQHECSRSLRLHLAAYGPELVRPKHHYLQHLTKQASEDGFWLDCFVHERKHQIVKDAATHIKNTRSFEHSVLSTVLNATIEQMEKVVPSGLLPPTASHPDLSSAFGAPCRVSNQMRFGFVYIGVGDFLFLGRSACLVEACVAVGDDLQCIVCPLELLDRPSGSTSVWRRTEGMELLKPSCLMRHAACWTKRDDGCFVALGS